MGSTAAATVGDRNHNNMRFTNNLLNNQAQQDHTFKFPAHTPLRSTVESPLSATPDNRATLQRRFTTDSMRPAHLEVGWDSSAIYNRTRMNSDSLELTPTMVTGFQRLQVGDTMEAEVCLLPQFSRLIFDADCRIDPPKISDGSFIPLLPGT